MKKTLTTLSLVAAMSLAASAAQPVLPQFNLPAIVQNKDQVELPAAVRHFLSTPEGQKYSAEQFARALKSQSAPVRVAGNPTLTAVVDEDFSGFTAGEFGNPASEYVEDASALHDPSAWTLFQVSQAGGTAYEGYDEVGESGPGYVKTTGHDVSEGEAIWRVSCRAFNANENAQEQLLQGMFFDEAASQIQSASSVALVYNEWTDCEWILSNGTQASSAMVFGWSGKVYIDDFKIEKVVYPLARPNVTEVTRLDVDQLSVNWDKVAGATAYRIKITDSFGNANYGSLEVGDVENAQIEFVPQEIEDGSVTVMVTAVNGEDESYPGRWFGDITPEEIGDAQAIDASDVTSTGFNANWTKADNALYYYVTSTRTVTAQADGEEVVLLDEDFRNLDPSHDEYNPLMIIPMMGMGNIDFAMSRAGWTTDFGVVANMAGMPCYVLTNMYAAYGLNGSLYSPVLDYSVGNGKVTVSGSGLSALGDIVMHVGFEGQDPVEVEFTEDYREFSVDIEGGTADGKLCITFGDATEDETQLALFGIKVTTKLNQGETLSYPFDTYKANYNELSARFETPVDVNNTYTYAVQSYYSDELFGEKSESVEVKFEGTGLATVDTNKTVQSVRYYNLAGQEVSAAQQGVSIAVTTYTDGTRAASKVIK